MWRNSQKLGAANSELAYKKRYGEDVGAEKWKQYTQKLSKKNTLDAFLAKGKTEEDFKNYNADRAITLENLVKKYGQDEGAQRFNSYREKQKDAGNTLEFFIKKYGVELGLEKYTKVCQQKGITLSNLTRKYGEEADQIKYDQFLEKTIQCCWWPRILRLWWASILIWFCNSRLKISNRI